MLTYITAVVIIVFTEVYVIFRLRYLVFATCRIEKEARSYIFQRGLF